MAKDISSGGSRKRNGLGIEYADRRAVRHYDAMFLHPDPYSRLPLERRVGSSAFGMRWRFGRDERVDLHRAEGMAEADDEAREWSGI